MPCLPRKTTVDVWLCHAKTHERRSGVSLCHACHAEVARRHGRHARLNHVQARHPVPCVPRLPRKTTVNVRLWHACHIKGPSSKHRRVANAFVKGSNFCPLQWALFRFQLSTFTEEHARGKTYQGLLTRSRFPLRPRAESFSFALRRLCLFGFHCASDPSVQTGQENGLVNFLSLWPFSHNSFFLHVGQDNQHPLGLGNLVFETSGLGKVFPAGTRWPTVPCLSCRWQLVEGPSETFVIWKKTQVLRSKPKCFATGPGGIEPWSLKRPWTYLQSLTWATGPMPMWTQDRGGSCRFVAEYARIANHALQIAWAKKRKAEVNGTGRPRPLVRVLDSAWSQQLPDKKPAQQHWWRRAYECWKVSVCHFLNHLGRAKPWDGFSSAKLAPSISYMNKNTFEKSKIFLFLYYISKFVYWNTFGFFVFF